MAPARAFPLAADSFFVQFPLTKRTCILSRHDLERLSACTDFLTLDEHANNIARQLSCPATSEEIQDWLRKLAADGVLISHSDLLCPCSAAIRSDQGPAPLDWLVIPTCNRPRELMAAARSYADNLRLYGRRLRLFISDQTALTNDNTKPVRSELGDFAARTGFDVFYAGQDQKQTFVAALCSGGSIPREIAEFALFGRADADANIGANRNATLLQTLGSLFVSVDDDTVCQTARVPGSGTEIRFSGESDPAEMWFFGDRFEAESFAGRSDIDFVGEHERLLGRDVIGIFRQAAVTARANVGAACHHMLEHLCFGGGRVLSTYAGLAGDPGTNTAFPFLVHPSIATRNRLRVSPEAYAQNIRSHEVIRQALCATITHGLGAAGLTACIGLDNRELLPPFFPLYSIEDGIFAQMITQCRDDSCFAHTPFTVRHDRRQRRAYADVSTLRMFDLILTGLLSCPHSPADTPDERLARIGKHLTFLGTRDDSHFHDWVQSAALARASKIAQVSQAALRQDGSCPAYWAEDVGRVIQRVHHSIEDPAYVVPEEVRNFGGLPTAREVIRQFGELVTWWPAIVERTKALSESGVSVGVRLV